MDLGSVADLLYAASPDDFVQLRNEQVAQARAAGDRALARQISALRRPTKSAWLVNLLARREADEVGTLLDLGAELRDAQSRLDAADLRRLSTERRRVVDALTRRSADLGAEHGYSASDAVRQEVSQTLQAALADPELSEQVRAGRVHTAIEYGGFGPFGLGESPSAATPPAKQKRAAKHTEAEPVADPAVEQAVAAAEAAVEAWQEAQEETRSAAEQAEQATREADELADRLERLRVELAETEQAERRARDAARTARKHVDELTKAEAVAERQASKAAAAVQDLRNND